MTIDTVNAESNTNYDDNGTFTPSWAFLGGHLNISTMAVTKLTMIPAREWQGEMAGVTPARGDINLGATGQRYVPYRCAYSYVVVWSALWQRHGKSKIKTIK